MKKIFLVLAVFSLTATAATAQPIRLGVKAGLTMLSTDVKGEGAISDSWNEFRSKDIGWNVGLMARINLPLTNLYVQPELLYNHANYRFTQKNPLFSGSTGQTVTERLTHGTIELPVLLGFKVLFLNAQLGPTFTLANLTDGEVYKIKTADVGFQAGLGLTLKKVTIDLRYQGYFAKKWNDIGLFDVTQKLKANDGYLGLSVGYFF
jgi:hypothetical protein